MIFCCCLACFQIKGVKIRAWGATRVTISLIMGNTLFSSTLEFEYVTGYPRVRDNKMIKNQWTIINLCGSGDRRQSYDFFTVMETPLRTFDHSENIADVFNC